VGDGVDRRRAWRFSCARLGGTSGTSGNTAPGEQVTPIRLLSTSVCSAARALATRPSRACPIETLTRRAARDWMTPGVDRGEVGREWNRHEPCLSARSRRRLISAHLWTQPSIQRLVFSAFRHSRGAQPPTRGLWPLRVDGRSASTLKKKNELAILHARIRDVARESNIGGRRYPAADWA
jgi:hypothetical protein